MLRVVALVLALAAAPSPAQTGLDALFSPLAGSRTPGLAVLVRSHGRTVFERGYGVRDGRTLTSIDASTNFRLASFSKQFTAMCTMLLVHDGKLSYDRNLLEIFPEFPAYGRGITVRHLLTHTSGLPDYEDLMDAAEKTRGPIWSAAHQITDQEVFDLLKQQKAGKCAPGTSWAYSNSGYVLLGLIVAKISGESFPEFLHERIFAPLHMSTTLAFVNGLNTIANRAYGHTKRTTRFFETDQSSTSATLGDGGIYSNLVDLAKWDDALEKHTLLSQQEMNAALKPAALSNGARPKWPVEAGGDNLAPGQPVFYGFGWFLDPYQSHARMWHFGSTTGFGTVIDRFTADRLTVIILCNRTDLDPASLALRAADILFRRN